MFKKILIAFDGSVHSEEALKSAQSLMDLDKEIETHILNIKKPPNMEIFSLYGVEMSRSMLNQLEQLSKQTMDKAKDVMKDYRRACIFKQLTGDPAQKIIDYSQSEDIDLILVGSRGLGGFKGMMLGSVSNKVAQLAEAHVMIIK